VATAFGIVLIAARTDRVRRARTVVWIAVLVTGGLLAVAAVSPTTFGTAQERLLSIGAYQTDPSVRYRDDESRFVIDKIRAKPLLGSGLADSIHWNLPWLGTRLQDDEYTHVGYLWLLWREGVIGAALLLSLLLLAAAWPGRAKAGPLPAGVRVGCQAGLAALLLVSMTFPPYQAIQIMYVVGFLVAYAAIPVLPRPGHAP
jgi:O-antigen ligase